jgi:hypothetical protein
LSLRYLLNATDYWQESAETLVAPLSYEPEWYRQQIASGTVHAQPETGKVQS